MNYEGVQVAQWLNTQGINAFVLKYRVANISAYYIGYRVIGLGNKYPNMLTDVEDALRYVYTHADSLHIDTTRIGVMGFSAGGHLAMMSATHTNQHSFVRSIQLSPCQINATPIIGHAAEHSEFGDSLTKLCGTHFR